MNQKLTKEWVKERLPSRPKNANKGTFGKVLVLAGSENYPGAAYLSCAAAYRVGAGLVTLATKLSVKIIVSKQLPEVTFLSPDETAKKINGYDVLLIGPGLGQGSRSEKLLKQLLEVRLPPTIIDGDGLNIISKRGQWWEIIHGGVVLTPHPGEMARLTGLSIDEIQKDRLNIAKSYSEKWKQVLVLKGANTIVASPTGEVLISPFANPALSTAGTGDILAGAIAGMLAQGLKLFDAAGVGVYVHGLAGESIREKIGEAGMLAGDLLPILPKVLFDIAKH